MIEARRTGTDLLPTIPWGTHFCQFYETRGDLLSQVVPYLKAGLESGEACVWVTSPPIDPPGARDSLAAVVPDLDRFEASGQLHIAPHTEWYLKDGVFDRQRVLDAWMAFLDSALAAGFQGLRVTGNTAWLEKAGWDDFEVYEAAISGAVAGRPVLVLCTYSLDRCGAHEILDVVKNHDFALIKRRDRWEVIEGHDRQVLRDALQESQARYHALFHEALSGIGVHEIVTDADGVPIDYVFLDVNAAFELMTGLEAAKVIGRRVTDVLPGIEKDFVERYGRVALTGQPERFESYAEPLGRYYDISAFSLGNRRFATIFRDITTEKRAAEERERLFAEATEANRLKDEFLATLSHELRTPLNAILGWSQLLLGGSLDGATRQRALEAIVRNADAQQSLVADVLDVSRIITGKLRLSMSSVDVLTILDEAIAAVKPAAEAKHLRLEKHAAATTARLVADPDRLRQILWNLLSNAVKFTPAGGRVAVEIGRVASRIEVRVSDSGVGIAPEFLPRVFERFMQADGSASRRFGGLGLGLAIVRHLVELHGGDVSAESAGEGHGATFSFRLPVRALADAPSAAEPGGRPAGAAATPAYDLSGVRVLVVDDEADARELVRVVLAAAGAEVSVTASAQEALGLLGDGLKVDVIISDIGMPEMDGYHLIQAMRALGGGTEMTPAIALTAYGRAEDAARALASGYQRHLTKPVTAAMLVSAVHHAVATDISRA